MQIIAAVLLLLITTSCLPKKSKTSSDPSTASASDRQSQALKQSDSLLGEWTSCESYPQGDIIGIRSSSIVYNFKDEKNMEMHADYFADGNCQAKFTRDMAVAYFKHLEELNKADAPEDVKQSVLELADGIHQEMSYRADRVAAGDVGTIDFLGMERSSYTSYKILGEDLQIANVCQDLVEEGCEPIGENPDNRATDVNDGDTLRRK